MARKGKRRGKARVDFRPNVQNPTRKSSSVWTKHVKESGDEQTADALTRQAVKGKGALARKRTVDLARAAYAAEGIDPISAPIRGGTDGSRLTEMGVPCPNLFTGQQDLHGPLEWISVQDMSAATKVCLRIADLAMKPPG